MEKNEHSGFGFETLATVNTKHVRRIRHVYSRSEIRPWADASKEKDIVLIRFEMEILIVDDEGRKVGQSADGFVQAKTTSTESSIYTAEWALTEKAKDEERKAKEALKAAGLTKKSFLAGLRKHSK